MERERQGKLLSDIKGMLAAVLPHISSANDIQISGPSMLGKRWESGIRFQTPTGLTTLSGLSHGYQTTLAMTVDLAWQLFKFHKTSEDPLREPAVVLIDEIDLHLHPMWQRTIIDNLTTIFPRVQFIATAHSPLLVQTALAVESVVIAVMQLVGDHVEIVSNPEVVRGWRVDQILTSDLFGYPSARTKYYEDLDRQHRDLLKKATRTQEEEEELRQVERELALLPTEEDRLDQLNLTRRKFGLKGKKVVSYYDD